MNEIELNSSSTVEDLEGEEWRRVSYLPPNIEVSSLGRVKKYITLHEAKLMKLSKNNGALYFCCRYKTYGVHRVVADAFLTDPPKMKRTVVIHKNGDRCDNRVENLEWGNPQTNLMKGNNQNVTTRRRVYCVETDQVFGSLISACYILRLPQEVVSEKMKTGKSCMGYTLKHITAEDPESKDHRILYISLEKIIELSDHCSNPDELHDLIMEEVGEGIPYLV